MIAAHRQRREESAVVPSRRVERADRSRDHPGHGLVDTAGVRKFRRVMGTAASGTEKMRRARSRGRGDPPGYASSRRLGQGRRSIVRAVEALMMTTLSRDLDAVHLGQQLRDDHRLDVRERTHLKSRACGIAPPSSSKK